MKNILKVLTLLIIFIMIILCTESFAEEGDTTKTIVEINITKEPNEKKYIEKEKFNPEGMEVTATYNDGTTKIIEDYNYSPTGELSTDNDKINISYTENGTTVETTQTINVEASLNKIVLSFEEVTLSTTSELTWGLVVFADPNGAELPELIWTSSDENVVKVIPGSANGTAELRAVSVGKAVVTVKSEDGKYSATCNVTVITGNLETIDTPDEDIESGESEEQDNTISKNVLPKTGTKYFYLASILVIGISLGSYKIYKKYKKII